MIQLKTSMNSTKRNPNNNNNNNNKMKRMTYLLSEGDAKISYFKQSKLPITATYKSISKSINDC